jgi:hypothetical protein
LKCGEFEALSPSPVPQSFVEVASQQKTLAIAIGNKVLFGNLIKEINFPIN